MDVQLKNVLKTCQSEKETKSVPEFFLHHSAESNVGSWQNALSVKIYKVDVRKIQNFRSYEKQLTNNGVGIPKSHIHVINGQKYQKLRLEI